MIGALIGDIVGSRFEFHNHKSKEFELFTPQCRPTDDSIMTLAVAQAIIDCDGDYTALGEKTVFEMRAWGHRYPDAGYGGRFDDWLGSSDPHPYNSWGNGAAMRVSACAWAAGSFDEALALSRAVTEVTHNHPEGLKGAEAVTAAIYMARVGESREDIRRFITEQYYPLDFTIDGIRTVYRFNESCRNTVPQALEAFFESESFEDALRLAVSVGGDTDTLADITCAVAEAYYGVPDDIRLAAIKYFDVEMLTTLMSFEIRYPVIEDVI